MCAVLPVKTSSGPLLHPPIRLISSLVRSTLSFHFLLLLLVFPLSSGFGSEDSPCGGWKDSSVGMLGAQWFRKD